MLIVQKHLQAVTRALLDKEVAPIGELLDEIGKIQDRAIGLEAGIKLAIGGCEAFEINNCSPTKEDFAAVRVTLEQHLKGGAV